MQKLEIVYYTDPVCCWSWAMEPQWRRLQYELKNKVQIRYCLGGLIADWKNYYDAVNSVNRPFQMGPLWMQAKQISGMPLYDRIWINDPPLSSYPACIAVKCAALQSSLAETKYLRYIREAMMLDGLNISKRKVLFDIAEKLSETLIGFNVQKFIKDFESGIAIKAFREDLQETRYKSITRFPSFTIKYNSKAVLLTGYKPYTVFRNAIEQIAPLVFADIEIINIDAYKNYFGNLVECEIQEAIKHYS